MNDHEQTIQDVDDAIQTVEAIHAVDPDQEALIEEAVEKLQAVKKLAEERV